MFDLSHRQYNGKVTAGFRFSWTDGVVVILCALATWSTWSLLNDIAALFPIVLAHFFLFCNVFRIPRKYELLWSAVFVSNIEAWLVADLFAWSKVLLVQTPVTLFLVIMTLFQQDYHGIGYSFLPWGRKCGNCEDSQCNNIHIEGNSDG
jgi:hypothetical protein